MWMWMWMFAPRPPYLPRSDLKAEGGERFGSSGGATVQLFEHIEVFYNQQRRHSLGQISPAEFERRKARSAA
jgi:hypothetical protein